MGALQIQCSSEMLGRKNRQSDFEHWCDERERERERERHKNIEMEILNNVERGSVCHSLLRFFLLLLEPARASLEGLFGLRCLSHSPSCQDLRQDEQKSNLHLELVHSALWRFSCLEADRH